MLLTLQLQSSLASASPPTLLGMSIWPVSAAMARQHSCPYQVTHERVSKASAAPVLMLAAE